MIDLKKYPKSKNLLIEPVRKLLSNFQAELVKSMEALDVEVPDIEDEVVESTIDSISKSNHRWFFTFFDSKEIYLSVLKHPKQGFSWDINEERDSTDKYRTRDEAELAGFEECFKMLEERV